MLSRPFPCDPDLLSMLLDDSLPGPRQDDVVAHLDGCLGCQRTLECLAAETAWWEDLRGITAAAVDVPLSTLVPESSWPAPSEVPYLGFLDPSDEPDCLGRLGPFAVTAFLGQGGMGIVLGAFDPVLDRQVAIKMLAPHFACNTAARKRFAREAQAAAAVVHAHVVPIHGVDSWKGLPYLVMSYVAGPSLHERIVCEGPLPVAEVLRIGGQAAAGLAAAHARGLVHRDVKPANILLEKETGRVLLTDFGLARAVDDASLTQSGVIPGTPQYMAPEQARGEAVDHRADLFSLGSTLYAMCTGRPPFSADTPLAVVRRVCEARPSPLRSLRPDVPSWLETLVERLLARDPAARFQSAAEVAEILAGCLGHFQQPDCVPLPVALRAVRPASGRIDRRACAAVVLLLLLGLGTAALLHGIAAPQPQAGAETTQRAPETRRQPGAAAAQPGEERLLEGDLDSLRRSAGALEADLKRSSPDAPDPFAGALLEQRRRLDLVECELASKRPR